MRGTQGETQASTDAKKKVIGELGRVGCEGEITTEPNNMTQDPAEISD